MLLKIFRKIPRNIFTQFLETYIFSREDHRILKPETYRRFIYFEDNYLRSRTFPFRARVLHLGNSPAIFLDSPGPHFFEGGHVWDVSGISHMRESKVRVWSLKSFTQNYVKWEVLLKKNTKNYQTTSHCTAST